MEIPSISPSEGQKARTLSFIAQPDQSTYPHITPGLYVFIQDKSTKEVFLMPSQSGHGHPFAANRVNQEQQRAKNDFSWIGCAGEMLFGYEGVHLGRSYRTGYFHKELQLTELGTNPEGDRVVDDSMPQNLLYTVQEWEMALSTKCRHLLFRSHGGFQKANACQLGEFEKYLGMVEPSIYPPRVHHLLTKIFSTVSQITLLEMAELSRLRALSSSKTGLFYHQPVFSIPEPSVSLENEQESLGTLALDGLAVT